MNRLAQGQANSEAALDTEPHCANETADSIPSANGVWESGS